MKVRVAWAAALAGAAVAVAAAPASAACQMSRFPIPVEMRGLRPTVLAKVNGHEVRFLLDSGSFFNGISARFAAEQKMRAAKAPPRIGSLIEQGAQTDFVGVAGRERASVVVQADQFEFANTNFGRAVFMTLPLDEGGLLGQNFLKLADVEYDFKDGTIFMVNVQDCQKTELAHWATGPYSMLPLDGGQIGQHTAATILVNGKPMKALFDTGAEGSFITRRAAARAGVKVGDADVKEAGFTHGLDGVAIRTWVARFDSVKLDTEEITKGLLAIGDSEAQDFDILIGADFFLSHHVYVANSQGKIYFTHSGGAPFNPGAESMLLPPPSLVPTLKGQ